MEECKPLHGGATVQPRRRPAAPRRGAQDPHHVRRAVRPAHPRAARGLAGWAATSECAAARHVMHYIPVAYCIRCSPRHALPHTSSLVYPALAMSCIHHTDVDVWTLKGMISCSVYSEPWNDASVSILGTLATGWHHDSVAVHEGHGRAVQVDPMKPTLKAHGTQRLILLCDEPLSQFALNFNLRRYTTAGLGPYAPVLPNPTAGLLDFLAGAYTRSLFSSN